MQLAPLSINRTHLDSPKQPLKVTKLKKYASGRQLLRLYLVVNRLYWLISNHRKLNKPALSVPYPRVFMFLYAYYSADNIVLGYKSYRKLQNGYTRAQAIKGLQWVVTL